MFATCCACVWESVRVATDVLTAMTHVFPAMTDVFPADTSSKRTARYISSYCPGYESSMTGSFLEGPGDSPRRSRHCGHLGETLKYNS